MIKIYLEESDQNKLYNTVNDNFVSELFNYLYDFLFFFYFFIEKLLFYCKIEQFKNVKSNMTKST